MMICAYLLQLWKKSGLWLNNTKPDFHHFEIPVENLEEIEEQVGVSSLHN